jgi:hypothetical protein
MGRGRGCDIRVEDARISGQHCKIYCLETREAGGRVVLRAYVEDTSSNGTYVNRRVKLSKVRAARDESVRASLVEGREGVCGDGPLVCQMSHPAPFLSSHLLLA